MEGHVGRSRGACRARGTAVDAGGADRGEEDPVEPAVAAGDGAAYGDAAARVLESFEGRDEYLEDIPVADTVIVLQALAERRGIAPPLRSPLLPEEAVGS